MDFPTCRQWKPEDMYSEVYKLFFLWFRASAILQTKGRHLKECCHPQWSHVQPFSPTIILRYLGEWKINENHMSRSTSIPDSELPNWRGFKGHLKLLNKHPSNLKNPEKRDPDKPIQPRLDLFFGPTKI